VNESGTRTTPTPVEERLRTALAARADAVGPADLRPLGPPAEAPRARRVSARRAVAGLLALAAVAALVFFTVRGAPAPHPSRPARSPHPTVGTPSPVPSPAAPHAAEPSPSGPQP
jgi:hypothetical protein